MHSELLHTVFSRLTVILLVVMAGTQQCAQVSSTPKEIVASAGKESTRALTDGKAPFDCAKCAFVVPEKQHIIDGETLGLKPGDVICLSATIKYGPLKFININGAKENPIVITNCGGLVNLALPDKLSFGVKTEKSKHFRITGSGDAQSPYGLQVSGPRQGITLDYLSTDFEVDHVEVHHVGFAGIMAKTDPSCDDATLRDNFTMTNISLHHNFIHDTGGEGFYVGNSFYEKGVKKECGIRLPHAIHGVKIHDNIVSRSGWESIQLGSATQGAEVYNNRVDHYGTANKGNQRGGIQIGEGTGGLCYNNTIFKGNGNGLIVLGYGDNVIFNNVIAYPGLMGIFCDERFTEGKGFTFINNTIVSSGGDGIRLYAEKVELNVVINNLIVNPGSIEAYASKFGRGSDDAYLYKLNRDVKIDLRKNLFLRTTDEAMFTQSDSLDFSLKPGSPARDAGQDVSDYNIKFDVRNHPRPEGPAPDIGAFEN